MLSERASEPPPVCDFGRPAPHFALSEPSPRFGDIRLHTPETARGPQGLLVMFICNHCPYVRAILPRLLADCHALAQHGIGSIAIMPNDIERFPQDGPEAMHTLAEQLRFPFPYVLDETQRVAHAYGAVCTPDFFGFNAGLQLQYRGRFDASGKNPSPSGQPSDLFEAMLAIAQTGEGPRHQVASIGCSIKWRADAVGHDGHS